MKKLPSLATTAALALTLLAPLSASAQAGDKPEGRPDRGGRFDPEMRERFEAFKNLNLTDDQKKQVRDIMQESRPAMEPLTKNFATQRDALRDLTQASPINEAAIREAATKLGSLEGDLAIARAKVAERVRAVLTPEQLTQYAENLKNPSGPGRRGDHDKDGQNGKGPDKEDAND